jgi:ABC-type transporter Mla maintaining outer membrane lipid asymmetry permease subunit MlaE
MVARVVVTGAVVVGTAVVTGMVVGVIVAVLSAQALSRVSPSINKVNISSLLCWRKVAEYFNVKIPSFSLPTLTLYHCRRDF